MADMNDHCDTCGEYHYMGGSCPRLPRPDLIARQKAENQMGKDLSDARAEIERLEKDNREARALLIRIHEAYSSNEWRPRTLAAIRQYLGVCKDEASS